MAFAASKKHPATVSGVVQTVRSKFFEFQVENLFTAFERRSRSVRFPTKQDKYSCYKIIEPTLLLVCKSTASATSLWVTL